MWKRKVNVFLFGIAFVVATTRGLLAIGELGTAITFALAALSLIPLVGFLESAVEELSELLGPFIGGLLHTTCSNIAELTIALSVLLAFGSGGSTIVLGSIAGVVIRNSLLFLGLATLLGCLRNGRMKFSARNAGEYSTVFALAAIGLSLPTLAHYVFAADAPAALIHDASGLRIFARYPLSDALAVLLLIIYLAYILFVVFHVRSGTVRQRNRRRGRTAHGVATGQLPLLPALPDTTALFEQERATAVAELHEDVEPEGDPQPQHARARMLREKRAERAAAGEHRVLEGHPRLRGLTAVVVLIVATVLVASMSEAFAHTVEALFEENPVILGQPSENFKFFLGLILIPVLAGMVELYGSVGMARRDQMEIAMAVTAGATIQMILLVVPVIVLVGAVTGHPLDLVFTPITVIIFGGATFTFMLLSRDGEATILEGVQLCALWLLIAVIALFLRPA